MGGLSWIKKLFNGIITRARLANTPAGGVVNFDAPGKIHDGVPYNLPVVVPYAIRDDANAVNEFHEAVADEMRHQFGTPFGKGGPVRMPSVSQPLEEWPFEVRRYVLEQCHLAAERNPIAKTAVFYTRAFSVQNGASISYKNKDVERICEAFINHPENDLRVLEKQVPEQLFIDGEVFLRFFMGDGIEGEHGETIVVPIEPWGITGIKTAKGFRKRIEYYRHRTTQRDGDDDESAPYTVDDKIEAADIHHIAINRLGYELRGRPDMFVMLPWLQAHKEWLENRARQNFWRGAVLFWVKLTNALPAQVVSKLNAYKKPPQPASVIVSNDKEEWTQFAPNVGANDASEDGRQFRAMAATGARLPEAWLSDGANANLATATAQALPAVMSFGEMQDIMAEQFWKPLLRRRIENAIEAGDLPEFVDEQDSDGDTVEEKPKPKGKALPKGVAKIEPAKEAEEPKTKKLKAIDAFDITYSELGSNEPKTVVEAVLAAVAADAISMETGRGLLPWPIDAAIEEKKIDAEREKQMDLMMQGMIPMPMGMPNSPANPNQGDNSNGATNDGKDSEDNREPAREALAA